MLNSKRNTTNIPYDNFNNKYETQHKCSITFDSERSYRCA